MKPLLALTLVLLVSLYGMPLPARAQAETTTFSLPECRANEACRISIEAVLRERYRLRLSADTRTPIFRWAAAGGELPPGLMLRANGVIVGTPRAARSEPYRFQVKIITPNAPGAEPLKLDMSLPVVAPQIRLVQVSGPKLVNVDAEGNEPPGAGAGASNRPAPLSAAFFTRGPALSIDSEPAAAANVGRLPSTAPSEILRSNTTNANAADNIGAGYAPVSAANAALVRQINPPPPCNTAALPAPAPAPGSRVFTLDARNGNLTENGSLVTGRHRFKKGERVVVVVDNKNPYLYTYKYSATATPVVESALNTFVPFIVGNLGELGSVPASNAKDNPAPGVRTPPGIVTDEQKTDRTKACEAANRAADNLEANIRVALFSLNGLRGNLDTQRDRSRRLADEYGRVRIPLYTPNQTRAELHRASNNFISAVHAGIGGPAGVDPAKLDEAGTTIADLKRQVARFKSRITDIRQDHPDCLPDIDEKLRWAEENTDEIEARVSNYQSVLDQIRQILSKAIEGRDAVWRVLCDPHAFFDQFAHGNFEATNDVDIRLEVTPRPNVTEATALSGSPFTAKFTFGGAPFFTISGGLIFSPLRKREYVRVQGFERDREGNLVLTDGKPNLTTVVGLKESSPTRINPAIFLNGRLKGFSNPVVDALHLSLGITAKNDNKGTDVEFLIGPSLSMLDENMFFTFGGYAGKQQKLGGNLFEGFALPSGVDELPIEKNYRWSAGFSLSYKIPVTR